MSIIDLAPFYISYTKDLTWEFDPHRTTVLKLVLTDFKITVIDLVHMHDS